MSEWAVVTVIVTLVGLIAAIVTPLVKLSSTLTNLKANMEHLKEDVETLESSSEKGSGKLWEHEKEQDRHLSQLELRLTVMEKRKK